MSKYLEESAIEPIADLIAPTQGSNLPPVSEALSEVAATSHATACKGGTNSFPPLWQPIEPQFTKSIAEYYGVSRKTVQEWFQKIVDVCPWFNEVDLKLPDERYTPLCIELMGDYRLSKLPLKAWKTKIWEQNIELVAAYQASQSASQPDEQTGYRPSGLVLHIGSSLNLPAIANLVPAGDDTAYLTQTQQRLQQFEILQQQVIAQMQQQHEQAQALNAQYQEATSLSDQLLLQEFQLKGVQLGYTALQLKQQVFKATIQAAESGTLRSLGKPTPENEQPPSV